MVFNEKVKHKHVGGAYGGGSRLRPYSNYKIQCTYRNNYLHNIFPYSSVRIFVQEIVLRKIGTKVLYRFFKNSWLKSQKSSQLCEKLKDFPLQNSRLSSILLTSSNNDIIMSPSNAQGFSSKTQFSG